jgi:hypothetical protein
MTDYFIDSICHSGSLVTDCDFCGRVHFATYGNEEFFDEGELEELYEKQKQNPEKYIEHYDCSNVSWGNLDGKQVVYDCPCDEEKLSKYEDFIWKHRFIIAKYLKSRSEAELKEKQTQNNLLKNVI